MEGSCGPIRESGEIRIIYEDNHLLAVEKPRGILTQGDITGDTDMLSLLKRYIKERYNKPGNVFLGMVHRLDRQAGGVMVFAKTSKAASRLSETIRKREFGKAYLAVIHGIPEPLAGTMRHFLQKDRKSNTVKVLDGTPGEGKEALLEYKTVESSGALSLVNIELITGRPHQIRVQFSNMGYPVYGDSRYGNGPHGKRKREGMALWSHMLSFKHPTRDEMMSFVSYPPRTYPWKLFIIRKK